MLDSCAADLVDAVARLCVLRTEDYTLLHTVFKRERDALALHSGEGGSASESHQPATSTAYIRYLTEEVERREEGRRAEEQRWSAAVRAWATSFVRGHTSARVCSDPSSLLPDPLICGSNKRIELSCTSTFPIYAFWETSAVKDGVDGGSFQQMYAAVVRLVYELKPEDLVHTPFAQLQGSGVLYKKSEDEKAERGTNAAVLASRTRVHQLFFLSAEAADASSSPTAILHSLHPLRGEANEAVTELSRTRLAMSRHVWLVLFFLWCHAIGATDRESLPHASGSSDDLEGWRRWMVDAVLVEPAAAFLRSQSQQLASLLMKVRTAHGA